MDLIGKQVLKGTMEKPLKMISGEGESEPVDESEPTNSQEEKRQQQYLMEEKVKMEKIQAKRRVERAKAREEIRQKHNLKSSESDQKILEESAKFSLFKFEEDESESSLQQAAETVMSKLRSTWDDIKGAFSNS